MIRVLCIVSAMNAGGAETFLMKLYRRLDREQYQMDFCVNNKDECLYDAEIRTLGGKIFRIPSKSESLTEFSKQLYHIVKSNHYKNVMRVTSNAMGFYDLFIAKKASATNCIARSSNSSDGGKMRSVIAHRLGKALFKDCVDVEIAPSDLAAIYTFGERDYHDGKVRILHNGIDFNEYRYSPRSRETVRRELHIANDTFLIGHIGRFAEQKNHAFLLELFAEVHRQYPNTALLLVGEGELREKMRARAAELGIDQSVIFAGVRRDVSALLSAMDLFILPSLYEGMPNVLIEAQASGLPCVASDRITKEVVITPLVKQLAIDSTTDWINEIKAAMHNMRNGQRAAFRLPESYEIGAVAATFTSFLV